MSEKGPERVPEMQPSLNGGPPKPPTKTTLGLGDGPSRDPRHSDVVDRLLRELSSRLKSPGLSVAERAGLEKSIVQLKSRKQEDT